MKQIYPLIFNEDTIKRAFTKYLNYKIELNPKLIIAEWEEFLKLLKESRE